MLFVICVNAGFGGRTLVNTRTVCLNEIAILHYYILFYIGRYWSTYEIILTVYEAQYFVIFKIVVFVFFDKAGICRRTLVYMNCVILLEIPTVL